MNQLTQGDRFSNSNRSITLTRQVDHIIDSFAVREIVPMGNAFDSDLKTLTNKERKYLYKFISNYKGKAFPFSEDPCICTIKNGPTREYGCSAMIHHFAIDVDGSVYPCRLIPHVIGRVSNLDEAWNNSIAQKIRSRKDFLGECNECYLIQYCGGCRAQTYHRHGDLFAEDNRCFIKTWMARKAIESIVCKSKTIIIAKQT